MGGGGVWTDFVPIPYVAMLSKVQLHVLTFKRIKKNIRKLKFLNKYIVQNLVMNKDLVFYDIVKTVLLEGKLIHLIISLLKVFKRD